MGRTCRQRTMVNDYVPERGDVVWLNFEPHLGHEQAGQRPALVISPQAYNQKTSLMLTCPITSKIKHYPFEVVIKTAKFNGVILADQIKSLDWTAREIKFAQKASANTLSRTQELIGLLVNS